MGRSSRQKTAAVNVSNKQLDVVTDMVVGSLEEIAENGVRSWLREGSTFLAKLLLNAEVLELVGKRYAREESREYVRWGEQDGSVFVAEQRVPIKKPRVRTKNGSSEVPLRVYEDLTDREFLNEKAAAKLLSGLSTRRFSGTLEKMLEGRGVGRQTISQRAIQEMSKQLEVFQNRSLGGTEILALFVDGIHLGGDVYVAAVGLDAEGKKHVLGFESGSTEGEGTCRALFANLIDRGILSTEGSYLFVIDGGKGLRKAIRTVFGKRAVVQRCMLHKRRNIEDKLPKRMQQEIRHKFNAAFNQTSFKAAEKAFEQLRRDLVSARRQGAANSLTEGLQEILTLHRLGLAGALRKSLCTTNCIESVFSSARYFTRNVKRWRGEEQMNRWIAAGLLEAESRLRKVPGYTRLEKLRQALQK